MRHTHRSYFIHGHAAGVGQELVGKLYKQIMTTDQKKKKATKSGTREYNMCSNRLVLPYCWTIQMWLYLANFLVQKSHLCKLALDVIVLCI